jgi:ABC-type glycerol-3-phosphate transport system substrate-binding protein
MSKILCLLLPIFKGGLLTMNRIKRYSVILSVLLIAGFISACGGAAPTVDTAAVDEANAKAATAEAKLAEAEAALESAGEGAKATAEAAMQKAEAAQAEAAKAMANVEPVEITVWSLYFDDTIQEVWDSVIEEFEAANPDIIVNVENRGIDAHKDAMRVTIGSAGAPDIYFMWAGLGLGGSLCRPGLAPLWMTFMQNLAGLIGL